MTTALQVGPPALTRPLSPFQRQVVEALCAGWLAGGSLDDLPTNDEIAARLGTPGATETVKAALRRAYAKAGLDGGLAVREAAGAVQDRPPARLGLRRSLRSLHGELPVSPVDPSLGFAPSDGRVPRPPGRSRRRKS